MSAPSPQKPCLYCGKPTPKGNRGEHIIPHALGGRLTLNDRRTGRVVCPNCNNGFLSQLDKALCSRSLLSFVAAQQLGGHLWQAWDVDHAAGHLLVEARPSWAEDAVMNSLTCYPQITFEWSGPHTRGDAEEFARFGRADAVQVLYKAARESFRRWCKTGEGLNFERIDSGFIQDGYRFAPRAFFRHSIGEIARDVRGQSLILRFLNEQDKRFALYWLSKISDIPKMTNWSQKRCSSAPLASCFFDVAETLRALMKIGLNLLAAYCTETPVDHETFAEAVRIIRGQMQMNPIAAQFNGFVHADDLQCIKAGDRDHSFRLMHSDGAWQVYSSFFGGRIGAFVLMPGPNREFWNCADVVAPIGSKNWAFTQSPILRFMRFRVAWGGAHAVLPSVKLQKSVSSMHVGVSRRKRA
jgi:hypothetical protein